MTLQIPEWNGLANLGDNDVPLLATAFLIASDEYPALDSTYYDGVLQSHADVLRGRLAEIALPARRMQEINQYLFDELGYTGPDDDYQDPRNSFINQVIERRRGNPISLALVQMEVARRLDIPLRGVSFPGHFLVQLAVDDGLMVMDPFNRGRTLDLAELRERARPHLGGRTPDDDALQHLLAPASSRAMLMRMLRNLHASQVEQHDWARAVRSADRLLKLSPNNADALRDRGTAYSHLGHQPGALRDLSRYRRLRPNAEDGDRLRQMLLEAGSAPARSH